MVFVAEVSSPCCILSYNHSPPDIDEDTSTKDKRQVNRDRHFIIVSKWKGIQILSYNLIPYVIYLCCAKIPSAMHHCATLPMFLNPKGDYSQRAIPW